MSLLKAYYEDTKSNIQVYGEMAGHFGIDNGVHQGSPASSILFFSKLGYEDSYKQRRRCGIFSQRRHANLEGVAFSAKEDMLTLNWLMMVLSYLTQVTQPASQELNI